MASGESFKLANSIFKQMISGRRFHRVLEKVTLVSAGDGNCQAQFTVTEDMLNPGGRLHGGLSATVIDVISSLAAVTLPSKDPGVSVNMNMSYFKSAIEGDSITVDARTVKAGKSLVFLEVDVKNSKSGDIIVKGSHTKCLTQ